MNKAHSAFELPEGQLEQEGGKEKERDGIYIYVNILLQFRNISGRTQSCTKFK